MYQTTKMVTRRAAAKRAAPADENAVVNVQTVKETVVAVKATTAQVKVNKRSALGDKSDTINQANNKQPLIVPGKTNKPQVKPSTGRVIIPAKPANKSKVPLRSGTVKTATTKTEATTVKTARNPRTARATAIKEAEPAENRPESAASVGSENVDPQAPADEIATVPTKPTTTTTTARKEAGKKIVAPKNPKSTAQKGTELATGQEVEASEAEPPATIQSPMDLGETSRLTAADLTEKDIQFIAEQSEEDALEPSLVHEYTDEIFAYMKELEIKLMPDPTYMTRQEEIHWGMRSILVDWLVQVHTRFQMQNESLFLCVNYIDRFLSNKIVSIQKFQLVGVTALLLAAKFEEISAPSIADLVYMVDKGYNADEIKRAERFMVQLLDFELGYPGPMSFLRRVSKADDYCQSTRTLAKYLIEVTIMDERFIGVPPSMIAAAGDLLARKFLHGAEANWSAVHVHYSGYSAEELGDVAELILNCVMDPTTHQSIYDKYADRRYLKASLFVQQWFEKYGYPENRDL